MTQTASELPAAPPAAAAAGAADQDHAAPAGGAHDERGLELTLMGVSSLIALTGIALAGYLWLKNRHIPDRMAQSFAGPYKLLLNKYYVDELYDGAIVQPIKAFSTQGLWKGVDVVVVDGAVNGAGYVVGALAAGLRLVQTGSVKTYAAGTLLGAVSILAYYLWR
jgi:NADH-quinone oxidoreductase subunit L